ncbi:MAG: hypothetical protein ACREBU_15785, partial [Nitrososphaera sp.]
MNDTESPTNSAQNSDVGELIDLYQSNSSARNNLWGIYVVATFAASGFVVTAQGDVGTLARIAMSLGFLAFTIGHGFLLYRTSHILIAIEGLLKKLKSHPLQPILDKICDSESKITSPFIAHVIIDICVIAIIWSKP